LPSISDRSKFVLAPACRDEQPWMQDRRVGQAADHQAVEAVDQSHMHREADGDGTATARPGWGAPARTGSTDGTELPWLPQS